MCFRDSRPESTRLFPLAPHLLVVIFATMFYYIAMLIRGRSSNRAIRVTIGVVPFGPDGLGFQFELGRYRPFHARVGFDQGQPGSVARNTKLPCDGGKRTATQPQLVFDPLPTLVFIQRYEYRSRHEDNLSKNSYQNQHNCTRIHAKTPQWFTYYAITSNQTTHKDALMINSSPEHTELSGDGAKEAFRERLHQVIRAHSSANALAKAAGVSEGALRKWASGVSEPSRDRVVSLARAAGVNVGWLAAGQGAEKAQDVAGSDVPEGFVPIPMLGEEESGSLGYAAFDGRWIAHTLHREPGDLVAVTIQGDAMEPQLSPGDLVLVDKSQTGIPGDGTYVLEIDGAILVRRLQPLPAKEIEASCANPAYERFRFSRGDDHVSVIGRVVWVGREV